MSSEKLPLFGFAGIDGAGKTTLLSGVASHLEQTGNSVFISKAYNSAYKEAFGDFMQTADDTEIMFMFQAFQRRQRNDTLARIALGDIVLADRWDEAYDAHHSLNGSLSLSPDLRRGINHLAYEGLKPQVTFYLQTKPSVANARINKRGENDPFDEKAIAYRKQQAKYYDERSESDPSWVTLDGHAPSLDSLTKAIRIVEGKL